MTIPINISQYFILDEYDPNNLGKSMKLDFDDCRQETIFLLKYSDIMDQE